MSTQRSDAQIEASRINGALSRGPVTEEGKASSSRNATRHGLLSNTILIAGESRTDFDRKRQRNRIWCSDRLGW